MSEEVYVKVKKLLFKKNERCAWVAKTPIGDYWYYFNNQCSFYKKGFIVCFQTLMLGICKTKEQAIQKAQSHYNEFGGKKGGII